MAFATRYIMEETRGVDWGESASFGATPGAYSPLVKARDIVYEANRTMIERQIQKTGLARGPETSLLGPMGGSVGFKLPVRGGKLAAGGTAESNLSKILSNCGMVRQNIADGIGKVTGGAAGNVTMLDGDATGYAAGGFICVNADKSGTPEVQLRPIIEVESDDTTTTISVTPNFSTTPVADDDLFALDSFKPAPGEPASYVGLDVYSGQGATNRHKIRTLGCAGNWSIPSVGVGELPMMDLAFAVDQWIESEAVRSDEDPDDLFSDPHLMLADEFFWGAETLDIETFAFNPGFPLIPMPGQGAGASDQGRMGHWYKNPIPSLEVNPYWDAEFHDLWANRTTEEVCYFNLEDADSFWGICIFKTQVVGVTPGKIGEGLVSATPTFLAADPHETAGEDDQLPLFAICFSSV